MSLKEKIKALFHKVWEKVDVVLKKVDKQAEHYVPLIINACEGLKKAIQNGTYDTAATVIDLMVPGDQSSYAKLLKQYLSTNLPTIIANLQLVNILADVDESDIDAQFKAVMAYLKNGNSTAVNSCLLQLSSDLVNVLSDGKFTKAERHVIIEKYYTKIVKNNEL